MKSSIRGSTWRVLHTWIYYFYFCSKCVSYFELCFILYMQMMYDRLFDSTVATESEKKFKNHLPVLLSHSGFPWVESFLDCLTAPKLVIRRIQFFGTHHQFDSIGEFFWLSSNYLVIIPFFICGSLRAKKELLQWLLIIMWIFAL